MEKQTAEQIKRNLPTRFIIDLSYSKSEKRRLMSYLIVLHLSGANEIQVANTRSLIAGYSKVKLQLLDYLIEQLEKDEAIIKVSQGVYSVNPEYLNMEALSTIR